MNKLRWFPLCAVLLILLGGYFSCSGSGQKEEVSSMKQSPMLEGSWKMEGYETAEENFDVSGIMIFTESEFGIIYTIMEENVAKYGRAHAGQYAIEGDEIKFTVPWWVENMHGISMVAEKSIEAFARIKVENDSLLINYSSGSVQKFTRTQETTENPLTGAWEMTGYEGGGSTGPSTGRIYFADNKFVFIYTMLQVDNTLGGRAHGGEYSIEKDALILELPWFIQNLSGEGSVSPSVFKREAHFTAGGEILSISYDNNDAVQTFKIIQ